MKTKVILSQQMASAIIAAGQEEAQKNNWSVSIAVCNQVNHLIPTRVLVKGGEITCKILK